jgi:hypothetical protein
VTVVGPETQWDRQELARQLRGFRKRRGLADETRILRVAPLLVTLAQRSLELEGIPSGPLMPRCVQLIKDALRGLSPDSRELLSLGLNLERSAKNLDERLRKYAEDHNLAELGPILLRERNLYAPLADFILEEVAISQARASHRAMAAGEGDATAAALFVAEQFKHYFRIFSPVNAVGADLNVYLIRRWREPDVNVDKYLLNLLWRWGQWELALSRFVSELGGNWIASSAEQEEAMVTAEYTARLLLPFGDQEASELRVAMVSAGGELGPLVKVLGKRKVNLWTHRLSEWASTCDCNPRRPKKKCEPHGLIKHCQDFTITVEREWYRLSAWYQLPPQHVSIDRDISGDYYLTAPKKSYDLRSE